RREALRQAAAERAAAARRRRMLIGGVAAVVVIALVVLIAVSCSGKPAKKATTAPEGVTSVAATGALGTKPTVGAGTVDLTKLVGTTLIQGTGVAVKEGQNLTVNYVGVRYKDGREFDSSWSHPPPPFGFVVGQGNVIKGWDQGLVGVKVGSRVQLD